jgi:regulatory protein YycI of two-component signal transduction system YycFG
MKIETVIAVILLIIFVFFGIGLPVMTGISNVVERHKTNESNLQSENIKLHDEIKRLKSAKD